MCQKFTKSQQNYIVFIKYAIGNMFFNKIDICIQACAPIRHYDYIISTKRALKKKILIKKNKYITFSRLKISQAPFFSTETKLMIP